MSKRLPISGFKWIENASQFIRNFIEYYNEDNDKGYFLEFDVQCP